jgi:photosystem II stability/assembly factor-like uncharacterized protein
LKLPGSLTAWAIERQAIGRVALLLLLDIALCAEPIHPQWDPLNEPGVLGRVESVAISPFDSRMLLAGGDVLGVGLSRDDGTTWEQTAGITECSEINDFTVSLTDPRTVWVGTLSGPYKSVDGGHRWTLKRSGMPPFSEATITAPIQKVVFDPNNAQVLLAFGGNHRHMGYGVIGTTCWGAAWKSTNAGENWTKLTTIDDVAIGGPNDGTGAPINDAGFAAGSSTMVFACSDRGGVYRSTDGGSNFTRINNGLPTTEAWALALHPGDPNILWVSLGKGGAISKSIDGGDHWLPSFSGIADNRNDTQWRTVAVAKNNPNCLYCAAWNNPGSAYRSVDGGAHWERIVDRRQSLAGGSADPNPLRFQWISVDPNNWRHVAGACESRVAESWDAGQTWRDLTSFQVAGNWRGNGYSGLCCTKIAWNPFKPGHVFTLGMDTGKLLRSDDSLWSWKLADPGLIGVYNGANDVTFARDGTIYVASGQFGNGDGPYRNEPIIKSTNWGETWAYVRRPVGAKGDNNAVWANPNDSREVSAIMGNLLYKSFDGGGSWSLLDLKDSGNLWNLAAAANDPSTIFVAAQNGIFKSSDGTNFSLMPGSPISSNFEYVYLDPATRGVIYAVSFNSGSRGGVYRYDGTWKKIFNKPQARSMAVDPSDPRRIAVITKGWPARDVNKGDGVWITEDGGNNWTQCSENLRMWSGSAIAFNPDKSAQLIVGMDGAGYYVTDLGISTAHGGMVAVLPGTIEATNYDLGSEGIAFHHATPDRLHADDDHRHLANSLASGNWLKFLANVERSETYDVIFRTDSTTEGARFHLEANGVNVTGPMTTDIRQGPAERVNVVAHRVRLKAGKQHLKFCLEAGTVHLIDIQVTAAQN